jgi:hypothetical protein
MFGGFALGLGYKLPSSEGANTLSYKPHLTSARAFQKLGKVSHYHGGLSDLPVYGLKNEYSITYLRV